MNKIIQTIKNIWNIQDLRNRILLTIGFIAIYRFGSFVVIPGVDSAQLSALQDQASDGLLGLLNLFTGGAFAQASIFALGIMPYISASIVIQLLGMAIPYFQKLQREGESGRRKINNITRYLTILITGGQAPGYIANLKATLPETEDVVARTMIENKASIRVMEKAGLKFVEEFWGDYNPHSGNPDVLYKNPLN